MRADGLTRRLAAAAAWLAAACPSPASSPVDASPPDASCGVPAGCPTDVCAGRSHVVQDMWIQPADQGFDLDGDGTIDNMIGALPTSMLESANSGVATSLDSGELVVLFHLEGWAPPAAPGPDLSLAVFAGYDWPAPGDPSDNFTGEGTFEARLEQFDLDCQPTTVADDTTLVDDTLVAHASEWTFLLTTGTGAFVFSDLTLAMTFQEGYGRFTADLGGVLTMCSLGAVPFPGDIPGNVLDVLINDPAVAGAVTVDIDVDGDGLEQAIGDGVSVHHCLDGDGTRIDGRDCICHPAIADGYSVGMRLAGPTARIVGLR